VDRLVAVDPAAACDEVRMIVPPGVDVIPQVPGTLGDRMAAVMRVLFERGASAVALLGSDLPDLQPRLLANAFALLADDPSTLVLGPAVDGGYYLIAATVTPDVFQGVAWGSDLVLTQTLANAEARKVRVELLDRLRDVDTLSDLQAVSGYRTAAWRTRMALSR
jgi:glycosyltransferase A (GT-A) superfamily protein (DUF2064 family)